MSKITRQDFIASLDQHHAALDIGRLDEGARRSLDTAGLHLSDLRAIAGRDGVIDTDAERSRLFSLIDNLDRNGSRHSIETQGTLSGKALAAVLDAVSDQRLTAHLSPAHAPPPRTEIPWLRAALGEMGQREIKGGAHNQRILDYHASVRGHITSDETPWCSSFVNFCMEKAGVQGTDSARALSWKDWGKGIPGPAVGAVAVIDWGGGKGHVGFVVGECNGKVVVAGGNQHNQVCYSTYRKDQIVGYRVPENHVVKPGDYTLPAMNVSQANESFRTTR